jgi:hypothetical protein
MYVMSYEAVQEKIEVLAIFKNGTIFPYVFLWKNKKRKIDKVNLAYQERDGASINYYYAIESQGLVAKMRYNDKTLIWELEEVWVDG